ncbi:MAG: serine/threonine protein kinase [Planctomycetaceae bacterium]|nr:serine/threonine protein kinase [Planctomycetaceae bacterium]
MSDEREQRLAAVLDELLNDSRDGDATAKLEDAVHRHPDLEQDLRELWATAMIADDVALLQSAELQAWQETPDAANQTTRQALTQEMRPAADFPPVSPIGRQIGDYELLEELGRGGMGVVYRARHRKLHRTVALKMIPNAAFASPQDIARLRAEALAAARLSHPNIVPVYEVGEHEGQPWFSMQFVDGQTLSQRMMSAPFNGSPIPSREAVALLIPIVEAIGAAHRSGILHRDLKPSNIMITPDGTPFVTDFGLAKRMPTADESLSTCNERSDQTALTQSGAILGTPAWMSPEQAAGQSDTIDVATDVYSLGAVLYAMLTGRPPFQSSSPLDTLLMVLEQDPPALRVLNPAVDPDLEMIVLKCLQKPRDLRYASADALAADLRAWLNGEPISARSSTIAQVMTRLFRESHHAAILQNWGLLWMWHSLVLMVLCFVTNAFQMSGVDQRWPYVGLWTLGLGLWAGFFWNVRHRAGPITAVERQIAHVWAGSMVASTLLFAVESIMDRPVLEFSPVLGIIAGIVFLAKAGMLSGSFYIQACGLFTTALVMAAIQRSGLPNVSISLFGVVSAVTFFVPGLKYYRQSRRARKKGTS